MKVLVLVALMAVAINAGKIDPALKARLAKGEVLDVMIEFPSLEDIFESSSLLSIKSKDARTQTMVKMLKDRTAASRKPFVNVLSELGRASARSIKKPIWISNRMEVENADAALVDVLSRIPGDFLIREEKTVRLIDPVSSHPVIMPRQSEAQWGVDMIQAPLAWNVTRGEGIVVGIIDTGVYRQHNALKDNYAGAWLDPYYGNPEPDDVQSHGSHALGSAVGAANGIGVAPGASWIACRGLNNQGSGSEANLIRCAQWMLDEASPQPHIVTNSWGGGQNDAFYNEVMRAWIVAGIVPVFALGNSGPSCRTANSPGDQIYCIGVGATTNTDIMAYFSSRGPARTMLKPEVSAPGMDIISAGNTTPDSYTSKSGTSMATPHVAGLVALVLSQDPELRFNFNQLKAHLQETADHPSTDDVDLNCGDGQQWPNPHYGHGRVNAARAVGAEKIYF